MHAHRQQQRATQLTRTGAARVALLSCLLVCYDDLGADDDHASPPTPPRGRVIARTLLTKLLSPQKTIFPRFYVIPSLFSPRKTLFPSSYVIPSLLKNDVSYSVPSPTMRVYPRRSAAVALRPLICWDISQTDVMNVTIEKFRFARWSASHLTAGQNQASRSDGSTARHRRSRRMPPAQ